MEQPKKGELLWMIPDAYIPPQSSGSMESHESVCVLNCYAEDAYLKFNIYFEDRTPIENIQVVVKGKRTLHIRTSTLEKNGVYIPKGTSYAIEVESNIPVIVQYSRLDTTQSENALMTTIAYPIK
ncbi:hypothetical protein LSG31_17320 [Fodinisporobacter ferrooxydans]|uniref:Sensory rhodopsin transducer n=1 Tax=Fodinisporobacter ferrooxydans TaxID=2901836 RepID=A0ABY4CJJ9_9BACL|nr:hypothetical protein LSG31_17320 [Alicyclobacillaceae bacterium MYW30-H2]